MRTHVTALALAAATALAGCGGGGGGGGTEGQRAPRAREATVDALANARGRVTLCGRRDGAYPSAVREFNRRFRARPLRARLADAARPAGQRSTRRARRRGTRPPACDVAAADVTETARLVSQGRVVDVTAYLARRESEFIPSTLETVRYAEKMWGVPRRADAGLLYRRTEGAGNAPPNWQALYDRAADTDGYVYHGDAYEGLTVHFLEVAYAAGGRVLSDDGRQSLIDSPENLRALELMVDGVRSTAVPRAVTALRADGARRAFESGEAALMRNWPSAYASVERSGLAEEFAVTPLPEWEGGGRTGVLGGHNLVISADSENPDGALALVDFLTSPERLERDAIRFGLAPVLKATFQAPEVKRAVPYADELLDAVRHAKPRPITPAYPQVSRAIYTNVNAALAGELSPAAALRRADRAIDRALRNR